MAKKTAKEVVQDTVTAVKEASEQTKATVNEKVTEAQKVLKEKIEEQPAVAEAVENTKKAVDKAVAGTKTTAKRAAATAKRIRKIAPTDVILQVSGKEISQNAIVDQIVEKWVADGNKKTALKELKLYLKPEDNAAYYVINGEITGKVEF